MALDPMMKRAMIYMEQARRLMISVHGREYTAEYLYREADETLVCESKEPAPEPEIESEL